MTKFKCEKCDHVAEVEGFCPKDGSALIAEKVADNPAPEKLSDAEKMEKLLSNLGDVVQEKVKATLKENGLDKETQEADQKIFPAGDKMPKSRAEKYEHAKSIASEKDLAWLGTEKDKEAALGKLRVAYFFKNLIQFAIHKDPEYLANVKALAEGVDADGGYLTPTEFRAQLVEDIQDKPFLRNIVTVIPMGSDSMDIPTLASSVKVSWGSENTAISTTTASFGTLNLAPKRLNTLMYTSRELVADSAINILPLLSRLFNEAIGREEDRVIINGSGSGQPKGILQETLTGINNANVDADLPANIKKLPFRLGTAYRTKAKWVMNSLSLADIAARQDGNNQFLFKEGIEGLSPHRLAGYPVNEQNDMPLDTLLFGDFSYYYLGDREKVSVETTTEGAGTFEKHQVAIKIVERIDGKVALVNAFRTITNAGID